MKTANQFLNALDPDLAMKLDISIRAFGAGARLAFDGDTPCCIIGHCLFIDGFEVNTYDVNYDDPSPTLTAVVIAAGMENRVELYVTNDSAIRYTRDRVVWSLEEWAKWVLC